MKQDANSTFPKYKARLVVKGFRQKKGVDFNEIFSLVVKMSCIRTVLILATTLDLEVEHMDLKTTFLHGNLEEKIYMKQPSGFLVEGKEDYVSRLRNSLYGLKQAPRQWYKKFESFMCQQGYKKTTFIIVSLLKVFLMMTLLSCYYMFMTCLLLGEKFPKLTG